MTHHHDSTVRIALLQYPCGLEPRKNLENVSQMIKDAAKQGAQVIITQELFNTPYFPQVEDPNLFDFAETIPSQTSDHLAQLAQSLKITLSVSLFEKRAAGLYHNTTLIIDPQGEIIGRYRKMHIPDDPGFYEKFYFTPGSHPAPGNTLECNPENTHENRPKKADCFGDITQTNFEAASGWSIVQTPKVKLGNLICWDQWFPEAARLTALAGAQIIAYPTAIGYDANDDPIERKTQLDAWQTVQRAHAIANGVFVAAANRVGQEGSLTFWGHSFIADPRGKIIAQANETETTILIADCDLNLIDQTRRIWPFLRDRRIDAYQKISQRFID